MVTTGRPVWWHCHGASNQLLHAWLSSSRASELQAQTDHVPACFADRHPLKFIPLETLQKALAGQGEAWCQIQAGDCQGESTRWKGRAQAETAGSGWCPPGTSSGWPTAATEILRNCQGEEGSLSRLSTFVPVSPMDPCVPWEGKRRMRGGVGCEKGWGGHLRTKDALENSWGGERVPAQQGS